MFARHRVVPALASAQVVACLAATIVVIPVHAHTSTTGNALQVPAAAYTRAEQLLTWNPNRGHGLNEPYVIRPRRDYLVQYLMGATPPDNYEITLPPDAAGTPGAGSPDDDPSSWR